MIYYFVSGRNVVAMQSFLATWGSTLADRIRIVTYEDLLNNRERVPEQGGSYIFTNLGSVRRMSIRERGMLFDLHGRLVRNCGAAKVLNDPRLSLSRFDMLRTLHERGINTFNAYRLSEAVTPKRFPVFLRAEAGTLYDTPPFIRDIRTYEAVVRSIERRQGSTAGAIAIEFCDTADSSKIYRKYGAFVVGDSIVPRHIFFSRNWLVKVVDLTAPEMIAEEAAYLATNPHADALLECARLAHISYGRIDYGVIDGRPQFWEINTNADITTSPQASIPSRWPATLRFVATFVDAMTAFDSET
jgi:hypothetical protein